MSTIIRPATEADAPALRLLTRDCVAAMLAAGIEQWDEFYPNTELTVRDTVAGTLHVLEEDGKVLGSMTVDDWVDPELRGPVWNDEGAPFVAVHRLMVHPSQQGRGLALALMNHVEVLARFKGCHSIRLDTFSLNPPALRLYEKLGYRRTGLATMPKGLFVGFEKML
ncbi:MAG: GNAT family N-acetyltransferase [Verrucomicrobiaceae bacterium]